ncbi:FkbM family methyltransferase [Maridesulfovibrio bastinii]|uniref:FkbM family methyltransferase n=1 Tax=Maridesulfovibrio bastinii TaxID=47157 RepID=UPI0004008EB8|nr:FkbM family methyltransferase [Maridesulfovibrio bastinii]
MPALHEANNEDQFLLFLNEAKLHRMPFGGPCGFRKTVLVTLKERLEEDEKTFKARWNVYPDFVVSPVKNTNFGTHRQIDIEEIRRDPNLLAVVGTPERSLCRVLASHGVSDVRFLTDPSYKKVNANSKFFESRRAELLKVFNLLEDIESKLTFASIVKYRITGDHGYLRIAPFSEYHHPIVKPQEGDVVFDIGASNGVTSAHFSKMVGKKGMVYAFEPEPNNIEKIKKRIEAKKFTSQIELVPFALGEKSGVVSFNGSGGSGKIVERGGYEVKVTTLDEFSSSLVFHERLVLSFDIEGGEQATLRGGLNFLRRTRPFLQISIYHGADALHEIPLWVSENLENYVFFMAHHDSYHCETDLYAIPKEMYALPDVP